MILGAGLPHAWAGRPQWRILATSFGAGFEFLAAWQAWKADPQRPALLHFVAISPTPVSAALLLRDARDRPDLAPLATELAAQWWGVVPGMHRLAFEGGRVLLTIAIGEAKAALQEQAFVADTVLVDDADPALLDISALKAIARLCRRGTAVATRAVDAQLRSDLHQCGFVLDEVPGLPAEGAWLRGRFDPPWTTRGEAPEIAATAARALVIGAGLAGSAAAASLARRGWQVQVLDRGAVPATGASALPAGLLAPHASPDDNLLSRLSRAGVRMTLQQAAEHLRAGRDWQHSGVFERRAADARAVADLGQEEGPWQERRPDGLWHAAGAWIKPAALVRAWLSQPGIAFMGSTHVDRLEPHGSTWLALDAQGRVLAEAEMVVIAAALGSGPLLPAPLQLNAVRGQVSWQSRAANLSLPSGPVNGNGHFLPAVPLDAGMAWLTGSTYGRGETTTEPRDLDHAANLDRLRALLPDVAAALEPAFASNAVQAWCGIRCASSDRRPLVGQIAPGLWINTAMGSRGLTFAWLGAELVAARLHGEPLPLPTRLAAAIDVARQRREPTP